MRWSSNNPRTVFRNKALPSPSVIRPLKSTTVTFPASRCVACSAIFIPLCSLARRGVLATVAIGWTAVRIRQFLGHHNFRAAIFPGHHIKFVHERAHEKNSAPRGTEQVLFREGVRHFGE